MSRKAEALLRIVYRSNCQTNRATINKSVSAWKPLQIARIVGKHPDAEFFPTLSTKSQSRSAWLFLQKRFAAGAKRGGKKQTEASQGARSNDSTPELEKIKKSEALYQQLLSMMRKKIDDDQCAIAQSISRELFGEDANPRHSPKAVLTEGMKSLDRCSKVLKVVIDFCRPEDLNWVR